ncbi:MAG: NAD(P)/FAD-dependent oxidoreductase [Candidatus Heimdallarchaeota archaeon]|nr:NAD(P)/FAD-dependent oxidoreductase [Candidatus Heimdallarchaeota archaeon]MCK4610127.1 NAD(P)/FAD-dependent oxidoreductase [Candidatus Heimdallarchaeota archaeon]
MSKTLTKYDVIIIGSGVGGLTAGVTIQTLNPEVKTLILEQRNVPGGYISGFKRKGYYFDSGAEGLVFAGEKQNFRRAIDGLGVKLEYLPIDPLEVLHYEDKTISLHPHPDKYQQELISKFPDSEDEIIKFFEVIRALQKEYDSSIKAGLEPSFKELVKIVFTRPTMRKLALKSYKKFLDESFSDPDLIKVLAIYSLWFGIPPEDIKAVSAAISFFSPVFNGNYYPKGGMFAFAKSLAETFVERGGEIIYKKRVTQILTKRRKAIGVRLSDGTVIHGKWIISNADLKRTVFEYVSLKKFPNAYLGKVLKKDQSVSGFAVFLGLDKELEGYPSHMAYNFDAEKHIKNTLNGIFDPKEVLIRIPSKIDPDLLNEGKSSVILLSLAPYNWENKWNSADPEKYKKTKEMYADMLIKLAENVIPDLSEHITLKIVSTPLTFERFSLNTQGAWLGPKMGGLNVKFQPPIRKLLLAGANIDGGGVPPSFFSGMRIAKYVSKRIRPWQRTARIILPLISYFTNRSKMKVLLNPSRIK